MKFTYDDNTFSDLHKEAYGFRPSGRHEYYQPETTPERKQEIWDSYCDYAAQEAEWERQRQAEAIVRFEKTVKSVIAAGAGDRETAIKWLIDAEDDPYCGIEGTCDYFNYTYDLPYSYDYKKGEFMNDAMRRFYCE